MELKAFSERVQVFLGPINVGVILLPNDKVALVDSGLDRRQARQILEFLSDCHYQVDCIFNTHAHADHIGGNAFLQETTGCRIFSGPLEAPAIENPLIQAIVLNGGAPVPELLTRYLVAEPSIPQILRETTFKLYDLEVEILDLPGHSIGQKGFLVDGVAFIGDSIFPTSMIQRHRLLFMYDPLEHLESLKRLVNLQAKTYVGGHFAPVSDLRPLVEDNMKNTNEVFQFLKGALTGPQTFERILKEFLGHFQMRKTGWEFFLYRSTLCGYLSALKRRGEVNFRVMDNLMLWFSDTGQVKLSTEDRSDK